VGGPGRGPGQFTNPYWVGFDVRGRIAVLEGPANNRFQFIDPGNGKSLDVLTEDVLVTPECDHVYFYENESGDHRAIFSTQVSCTSSSGGLCTIHKYDINSRKSVSRFARKDKVDKNALGASWILGYDGDERLYIFHVHGVNVSIYNISGEYIDKISLNKLDSFKEIDYSKVRGKEAGTLVETDRSLVWDISAVDGHVVIHHGQKSGEDITNYMSVFDGRTGEHLATTPGWTRSKHELVEVQGDRFFFVETDRKSDVGSYVIQEYRYEGIGK